MHTIEVNLQKSCILSKLISKNLAFYRSFCFPLHGIIYHCYGCKKDYHRILNEKVYVVDPAFVTDRKGVVSSANFGWRLENVIYVELLRRNRPQHKDIFYYRDRQWEVDFMVTKDGQVEQLIQVSYDISNEKTKQREINALVKAAEKFHCDNLLLINMDVDGQFLSKGHTVRIMLATDWLLS